MNKKIFRPIVPYLLSAIGVLAIVALIAAVLVSGCSIARPEAYSPAGVEKVIQENLATWRFKPGEEVFLNRSAQPVFQVALAAAPDGRLFLAWTEGRRNLQLVVVGSPDGTKWATKITLDLQPNYVLAVAIAANGAGEVVVVWPDNINCWAVHRSSGGKWAKPAVVGERRPEIQRGITSSVALTVDPDGAFWLLALAGPRGAVPTPRLWKREDGGGWEESSVPTLGRHSPQATLGYREGLLTVANGDLVRLPGGETWNAGPSSPWARPPMAQRTVSLWIRPTRPAAALTWSLDPVQWGAHLLTSSDLEQWSKPAFLGWTTRSGCAAVATTEHRIYVATTFEPWWWDRVERAGHEEVVWSSPRVFTVDDRLTQDTDGDGLTDITEEWLVTNHQNPDTDGDGTPDAEDLDPLAAWVPDTEEAQIRQAVFDAVVHKSMRNPLMVVAPERQVFANHQTRVLCLKREEAEAYKAKYSWALTSLEITNIQVAEQGQTATAKWSLITAPMAGRGGQFKLEKRNGEWVVTDQPSAWVS